MLLHHGSADTCLPYPHTMTTYKTITNYVYSKAKKSNQNNLKIVCEEGLGHTIRDKGRDVVKQWLIEVMNKKEEE